MADVEAVKIESDERGFELHIVVGDDIDVDDEGRAILNVQGVAEELLHEVVTKIGPWVLEGLAVKREYDRAKGRYDDEDDGPWPGESVMAFYQRTGQDGPLREVADAMNKARKEQ